MELMQEALSILRKGCACGLPSQSEEVPRTSRNLKSYFQDHLDRSGFTNLIDVVESNQDDGRIAHVVKPGSNSRITKVTIYVSPNAKLCENEIEGLLAHEVGTHALRMLNDDQQIWARGNRKSFVLKSHYSTEEGLACLNSLIVACSNTPNLLWFPALRYWAAAMSENISFNELFHALTPYISNSESRHRFCQRAKRAGIRDQAYLIGAIDLLRNIHQTDFVNLYSGMIHRDDSKRLKVIARTHLLRLPSFMRNMDEYIQKLRLIGVANGIQPRLVACIPYSRGFTRETSSSRSRSLSRNCTEFPKRPPKRCASHN